MLLRALLAVTLLLASQSYAPVGTPAELGLSGFTKVLCSAVFLSGRDPKEAATNSAFWWLENRTDLDKVTWTIDRERKTLQSTLGSTTREASYTGDQGCVLTLNGVHFTPVAVPSRLPEAMSQPWPNGDRLDTSPLPANIDQAKLDAAVDAAFADPAALTAGLVIVYKGRLIAERYMPGITKDTQLESWSMGKSILSTLFALLVKDGTYTLEQPAPVPLWSAPGDPRGKIRNIDLLQMSSGLKFVGNQEPGGQPAGYPDHYFIYTGAVDAYDYSIHRPLEYPPGTDGRYRNCDPLTIGYLIKQAVTKRGEQYLTWPQRALFDKIGIRRQVLETDPYGNFLLTGHDYGTPRNWARLGMLYLQDGMWPGIDGKPARILPEGWAKFVSTVAPAWRRPEYGGLFWINGVGSWTLPPETYLMAGAGGQNTFIVPSHDLVVVRMGHYRGSGAGRRTLNNAFTLLMQAIKK